MSSNYRLRIAVEQDYDTSGTISHGVKVGEITRENAATVAADAYANYIETNNEMGAEDGWQDEPGALTEQMIYDYIIDMIDFPNA